MELFDSLPGWIKWLVGSLGVLGVGVLTNALWELLVRPASFSLARWISSVASLGVKSLQDSMYRNAARNPSEIMIQEAFTFLISMFVALVVAVMFTYYAGRPSLVERAQLPRVTPSEYQQLLDSAANPESASLTIVERRALSIFLADYASKHQRDLETIRRIADYACSLLVIMSVWILVGAARLRLARELSERYRRRLALLRPVLSDNEVHLLNAEFAAIERAEDFRRLIDRLTALDTERLAHLK